MHSVVRSTWINRCRKLSRTIPTFKLPCFCSTMDTEDDFSMYSSHSSLTEILKQHKNSPQKGIEKYLTQIKLPPVTDFQNGLEWFNVSEPLSFQSHLKGKLVLLDFFTYCCINCMHILPDLQEIETEYSIADGLVVIGVHSAKFENEKQSANILAAVQRYNIHHPVVNDHSMAMWRDCDVHCWPTLLLIGPDAKPIVMVTGEGNKTDLLIYIKHFLAYYKTNNIISDHLIPIKPAYHLLSHIKGPFLFPGKITNVLDENNHEILAISDSGNNRILITEGDGTVIHRIGGNKAGFRDGKLSEAEFNNPQGLIFESRHILYVADTDNHAIRRIDLRKRAVETIAGTGVQGNDRSGGNIGRKQAISSPWDVALYHVDEKRVLLIAMAGLHQIWGLFLDEITWWKGKKYAEGACVNIAGSGSEENRNNQYPHAAAFAQPSGLALSMKNKEVFIADSESSAVRRLSLVDGRVTPVVGGDRNPRNLFAFGDRDGQLFEARLQHSLGVALTRDEKTLFVADTYNHKVKKVDIANNSVRTLVPPSMDTIDGHAVGFKEPAGLCVSADGGKLYLADTNNHLIKILSLNDDGNISNVELFTTKEKNQDKYRLVSGKTVEMARNGGEITLKLNMRFKNGLKLTEGGDQKWYVDLPDHSWTCNRRSGGTVTDIEIPISVPGLNQEESVKIVFDLVTCTEEKCFMKAFVVDVPIKPENGAKNDGEWIVDVILEPHKVYIE